MKRICSFLLALLMLLSLASCEKTNVSENSGITEGKPMHEYPNFSEKLNYSNTSLELLKNESAAEENDTPEALSSQEMRAVWFSFVDYTALLKSKDENLYTQAIAEICKTLKENGFNTLIFQVRPYSDSVYPSAIYPTSTIVSGSFDTKLNFDPLKIAIEEAHKMGLELHAWINPMRAHTEAEAVALSDEYQFKKWYNDPAAKGKNIVYVESLSRWYYNPTVPEVRSFIASGVREIVGGYDVDGIHIDDYFYVTTEEYFDKASYESYKNEGGALSLEDFRRDCVSKMVKELYDAVKSQKSEVVFGVSPGGNLENCYEKMYADVALWCKTPGYLDYVCPQLYYSFEQDFLPFDKALDIWSNLEKHSGVKLYIGLAPYKVGGQNVNYYTEKEKNDWISNTDMLSRQVLLSRKESQYGGFFMYSYCHLFEPSSDFAEHVNKELNNLRKLF